MFKFETLYPNLHHVVHSPQGPCSFVHPPQTSWVPASLQKACSQCVRIQKFPNRHVRWSVQASSPGNNEWISPFILPFRMDWTHSHRQKAHICPCLTYSGACDKQIFTKWSEYLMWFFRRCKDIEVSSKDQLYGICRHGSNNSVEWIWKMETENQAYILAPPLISTLWASVFSSLKLWG